MSQWLVSRRLIEARGAYQSVAPGKLLSFTPGPIKIAAGIASLIVPAIKILTSDDVASESGRAAANLIIGLSVHTVQNAVMNIPEPPIMESTLDMVSRRLVDAEPVTSVIRPGFTTTAKSKFAIGAVDVLIMTRTGAMIWQAKDPANAAGEEVAMAIINAVFRKIEKRLI